MTKSKATIEFYLRTMHQDSYIIGIYNYNMVPSFVEQISYHMIIIQSGYREIRLKFGSQDICMSLMQILQYYIL